GSMQLGLGQMLFTNQGMVDANNPASYIQIIPQGGVANALINTGTMQASNGSTLYLYSGDLNNTGGLIQALDNNSLVYLYGGISIRGGTLSTSGTGRILSGGSVTLSNLTNTGTFVDLNANVTNLSGAITNSGG